ncbi:MAG: hypothetical protein IT372_15040, partial [Polyangiaceae bacterium]|nr:hypothetical protein [Polyangiaceae bacterium]
LELAEALLPGAGAAVGCAQKEDRAEQRAAASPAATMAVTEKQTGNRYGVQGPADNPAAGQVAAPPAQDQSSLIAAPAGAKPSRGKDRGGDEALDLEPPPSQAAPPPPPQPMMELAPPSTPALRPARPRGPAKIEAGTPAPANLKAAAPHELDGRVKARKDEALRSTAPAEAAKPAAPASPCSDIARRPLAERIVVWSKRVAGASSAADLIARYEGARATCEIPDWRARSALLGLLQEKVRTEGAAQALLAHFAGEPEAQKHIGHAILRRSVDPAIAAAVRRALFDERMSWTALDEELAALGTVQERLARLRQAIAAHPDDPEGEIRRVRLLAEADQKTEALAYGRRLRDRGFMSPSISLALGDLFAAGGFEEDAVRTYSEIVEFDPASPASRRLLGDVYLRHRWYPAAYRQYATLTDIAPDDPAGWLRLAAAAAGSGRVDEALRLQRKVSSAEGTPGPRDPRAWARLLSAARLGRLLADPAQSAQAESLSRKLKELQIFSGPAAIRILVWEDYAADLALAALEGGADAAIGDVVSAPDVGLASVLLPASDLERLRWIVRWRSDPPGRGARFEVTTITWDGASFKVTARPGELGVNDKEAAL